MSHSVVVGFLGHHVVVEAEEERVVGRVARSFQQLLATGPSRSIEVIRVQSAGDQFELTLDGEQVFQHPELGEVVRMLRHEVIDAFVRAHGQFLWLHAGAAVSGDEAVLFVGAFGRGKSTLVTQLCARGWTYASDDIVPVDLSSGRILPFPLTPIVREDIGAELPRERMTELRKVRVWLPPAAFQRVPVPIGGIVLPRYNAGTGARLEPFSPAGVTLDLVREAINGERNGAATVALCARLVHQVPVLPITFSDPTAAADLVESRFREAGQRRYG